MLQKVLPPGSARSLWHAPGMIWVLSSAGVRLLESEQVNDATNATDQNHERQAFSREADIQMLTGAPHEVRPAKLRIVTPLSWPAHALATFNVCRGCLNAAGVADHSFATIMCNRWCLVHANR
jgi:hypothetical protein